MENKTFKYGAWISYFLAVVMLPFVIFDAAAGSNEKFKILIVTLILILLVFEVLFFILLKKLFNQRYMTKETDNAIIMLLIVDVVSTLYGLAPRLFPALENQVMLSMIGFFILTGLLYILFARKIKGMQPENFENKNRYYQVLLLTGLSLVTIIFIPIGIFTMAYFYWISGNLFKKAYTEFYGGV